MSLILTANEKTETRRIVEIPPGTKKFYYGRKMSDAQMLIQFPFITEYAVKFNAKRRNENQILFPCEDKCLFCI